MLHIGTTDVDLSLDSEALADGEYAKLVELLMARGYRQRTDLRRFQLSRKVALAGAGPSVEVLVDFLMPRHANIAKNKPPLVRNFAVQRADGADLALRFYQLVAIEGDMPEGGVNSVLIAVASIPALLAMKGYSIADRHKLKDAYDIYYCVRNYPDGVDGLTQATRALLRIKGFETGYRKISSKFRTVDDYDPTCVRQFVIGTSALGGRTPEQWQQDAFGQVDEWLSRLGLRSRQGTDCLSE